MLPIILKKAISKIETRKLGTGDVVSTRFTRKRIIVDTRKPVVGDMYCTSFATKGIIGSNLNIERKKDD